MILLRSDIRLTPSDICFASFEGEYNITAEQRGAISLSQSENITPSKCEAYHLICIYPTNAALVRKSRRTFGTHKPKAPSGRELPTKWGEGERVTMKFSLNFKSRGLLPPLSRSPFLPEEGFVTAQ